MAAPPSYHNLFGVLMSQIDAFSREIEETMDKTLVVQANFHKTYRDLVAVEATTFANDNTVSDAFKKCQQTYNALLWAGRELATSTAGVNCLSGFCNLMVPELISNPQVPHEDLILAIREFMDEIPSNPTVARDGNDFTTLIDNLRALEAMIEPETASATELDPNIAATAELLEQAKAQLKKASTGLAHAIHTYIKALGVKQPMETACLILAFAVKTLCHILVSGRQFRVSSRDLNEAKEVMMAYTNIQRLEAQLQECQEEHDAAIATSQKASAHGKLWMTQLANLRKLTQAVGTIAHNFKFLVDISAAIRKECGLYIKFLESRSGKVPAKKTAYHVRLRSNAELYKVLIPVLSRYASTVVMHG